MDLNDTLLDYKILDNPPERHLAGFGQRIINFIVDKLVVAGLGMAYLFLIALLFILVREGIPEELQGDNASMGLITFVITLAHFSYYLVMESVFGRTVGKLITNTKVVNEDGEVPDTKVILKRTLSRLVPFNALSFMGELPRGWRDEWSDTYVIKRK